MLNKAEYPRTVTAVQSLLLNYQPNYNSNRNSQSNGVRNQLMFAQRRKIGDNEGNRKEKYKRPRRNLDHTTCNNCGEKWHYYGNSDCPTQANLKEDAEVFRKMNQDKYSNKPPGGGYQKVLVNVKDPLCSLIMGDPTKEWVKPPSPGLIFFQTSTQEVPQTEHIKNSVKKGNAIIMHLGDNILTAVVEAVIDENWCLLDNQLTCNAFINGKYLSNIRYAPDGQYLRVHCKSGVTHTNKIGDLPRYSDPVWYNPKVIAIILSLGLVHKNHPVTYNSQAVSEFVIHIPQWPTFKITKAGMF